MPTDLTIFAANYLVFVAAVIALAAVALVLYRQPRGVAVRCVLAAAITAVMAEVLAHIGDAIYNDPRPFTVDHVKPLIPHAADNGFPSDHALLAAFLVVCLLLARAWFAVPLVLLLAALVDWARVGSGIHHPVDVIASTVCVAIAALIALAVTPFLLDWISPHLPRALTSPEPITHRRRSSDSSRT